MVECALVEQTHTVNTYVSCRSSLHSNPQQSNTCLLRSTSPKVGSFYGNQAAAFDDGSHEMTPADNAGSSESPRGRMDGWMCGWVGVSGGVAERNYGERERQLFLADTESYNHSTAHLFLFFFFSSWSSLPGTDASSNRNTVNQMRHSRDSSQPHHGWRDLHASCWFMCQSKGVITFFCLGCERERNVWGEVHAPPSAALFLYLSSNRSVWKRQNGWLHNHLAMALQCSFSISSLRVSVWPSFHIRTLIMCERSRCISSKLFVVRSDCYSLQLCNILE